MPHKHKRRGEADKAHFDLPPSEIAKALPVRDVVKPKLGKNGKKLKAQGKDQNQSANKAPTHRLKNVTEDDTPRAFRHLMQYQQTGRRAPSGLETGERPNKRKRNATEDATSSSKKPAKAAETQKPKPAAKEKPEMPKIMAGERLAEFVARVDREMPLSQMTKSVKTGDAKNKEQHKRTKHEKHLLRLQKGWREEDAKIRAREQEEREEREDDMEVELRQWKEWEIEAAGGKKKAAAKRNKKKGTNADDSGDDDPDPWAKLKKRDEERKKNPFEVAKAPPQLVKPREIFKVRGGAKVDVANVPAAVGSLRRREELASERRNIVEEYRKLMAAKRQ
ncbi:hypothetical protein LT330_010095 [Penicillium expansum]|uniref:Urease accessory protein UreD n=1 Tax=Penicillium expansum TaxID=27334 RepID=A0A0A2JKR4_PENEN|nr:hypothetical protein PEX2_006420 [Penicillium expansum]KAK4862990.1 hypothetical protein LT330_010647 [Penicillium expansum]KAK4864066.1 hypothetical protein LT330_010095 [Penicillium expansum]KGO41678.1 hypothetical protein PEXP_089020 [Penicillium expansum]KGO55997.1 hypothetical protein PEX2_006420 [Penicillium expansum]KGO56066.1 hypothetical protein PEX1_094970 [Penicillium expansum]